MTESSKSFKEQLEKLIELFKKVKQNTEKQYIPGVDPTFYQNIDLIIQNYNIIKDNIPDEIVEQLGKPIQDMMVQIIKQLKEELGEIVMKEEPENTPRADDNKESSIKELKRTITEIDDLLADSELSDDEINKLLDERNRLSTE